MPSLRIRRATRLRLIFAAGCELGVDARTAIGTPKPNADRTNPIGQETVRVAEGPQWSHAQKPLRDSPSNRHLNRVEWNAWFAFTNRTLLRYQLALLSEPGCRFS